MWRWLWGSTLIFAMAGYLGAEEPVGPFLDALKQEELFDLAVAYVDRVEKNGNLSAEMVERLPLERALLAVEAANREVDFTRRRKLLADATAGLEAARQKSQLPSVQVEVLRALLDAQLRIATLLATQRQLLGNEPQARELQAQAVTAFDAAGATASELEKLLGSLLKEMQGKPPADQDVALRDRYRATYVQSQIARPTALLESGGLLESGSPEARKRLKEATDRFADLADQYATSRFAEVSLTSLLRQAECLQKLESLPEALELYQEVLQTEGLPVPYSAVATKAVIECWTHPDQDKLAEAIRLGEQWLSRHESQPAAVTAPVRLAVSQVLLAQAKSSEGKVPERMAARARRLLVRIVQDRVAETPTAQRLLAGLQVATTDTTVEVAPGSFAEAKLEGDTALAKLQLAISGVSGLESGLSKESDAALRAEWEARTATAEARVEHERQDAIRLYRRALDLAATTDPIESVNEVRYVLAYLFYENGDYWDAAVLSEYLARHFSESRTAKTSARIALGAYFRLYETGTARRDSVGRHLMAIAEFAANRWGTEEVGQQAMLTLIRFLASQNRIAEAREYVARLPKTSPLRTEATLSTGVALYREYQSMVRDSSASDRSRPGADALALRESARDLIQEGLEGDVVDPTSATYVMARLTRSRIHLDDRQPSDAIRLLIEPAAGPYALLRTEPPRISDDALVEEILRTTLQAYLASLSSETDDIQADAQVSQIMDELRERLGSSPEGQNRLMAIYVALAHDLREQIAAAPAAEQERMASSFIPLLERLATASNEPSVLIWVGHTLQELAELFPAPPDAVNVRAQPFIQTAEQALQRALKLDAAIQDPRQMLQIQMRLASLKRQSRDFSGAIDLFQKILSENPYLLSLQMEAAYTYQDGGAYRYAIKGGRPDSKTKKNVIWGWERISTVVSQQMRAKPEQKEKYNGFFHEARYNVALARYREAMKLSGEQRIKYLRQARQAIQSIAALYPDLGGPAWKSKYDSLQRDIDTTLEQETADTENAGKDG